MASRKDNVSNAQGLASVFYTSSWEKKDISHCKRIFNSSWQRVSASSGIGDAECKEVSFLMDQLWAPNWKVHV